MEQATKDRLTDRNIWARALYALFFVIAYAVAEILLTVVVIFQYGSALVTGQVNELLHRFGNNLSAYVYDILQFMTFNSEALPFPFNDWPDEETGDTPWSPQPDAVSPAASAATPPVTEAPAEAPAAGSEPTQNTDEART